MYIVKKNIKPVADVPELAWTDIPGLYLNELDTTDDTLKVKTLSGLIIQKLSLKEGQRTKVYDKVCDVIESGIVGEVRNMAHTTISSFAKLYPNEMLEFLKKRLQINVGQLKKMSFKLSIFITSGRSNIF